MTLPPLPEQQRTATLQLLTLCPVGWLFAAMAVSSGVSMQTPAPTCCTLPLPAHWSETLYRGTLRRRWKPVTASVPLDAATKARNARGMQNRPAPTHPRRMQTRGQAFPFSYWCSVRMQLMILRICASKVAARSASLLRKRLRMP